MIHNIGAYIAKCHIDGEYFVNFADGRPILQNFCSSLVYRYGKSVGCDAMMNPACSLLKPYFDENEISPLRAPPSFGCYEEMENYRATIPPPYQRLKRLIQATLFLQAFGARRKLFVGWFIRLTPAKRARSGLPYAKRSGERKRRGALFRRAPSFRVGTIPPFMLTRGGEQIGFSTSGDNVVYFGRKEVQRMEMTKEEKKDRSTAFTQEKILIRSAQCDMAGRLSLGETFLISQEIAGLGCEDVGFGQARQEEANVFWVLSRVRAEILKPPMRGANVCVKTWHGDPIRYIFPRYFAWEDDQGELLAQVSTVWMLIDRDDRSIVMPSMRGIQMPPAPADLPKYTMPGKISFDFPLDKTSARKPLFSDFDLNGHMNNSRYPVWICDLFEPRSFYSRFVRSLHINYVKEISFGEEIVMEYGVKDDAFAVRGRLGEETRFEAVGEFGAAT